MNLIVDPVVKNSRSWFVFQKVQKTLSAPIAKAGILRNGYRWSPPPISMAGRAAAQPLLAPAVTVAVLPELDNDRQSLIGKGAEWKTIHFFQTNKN
jgi:hypothetical protein